MMALQDNPVSSTEHFDVIPLESTSYFLYLLVLKSHTAPSHWLKTEKVFDVDFSGNIVLDRMLHVGNSKDRFVVYKVIDGAINDYKGTILELDRKDPLRILSNSIFRNYPEMVANSILNSSQKKLLLHGLSI
ncbi:MAG: type II toxin-antitoxin system RnlB family antitoxin [Cytobacillus gottheilii]|uniref:type II toxin-antitoxin system RnlB family antitoxin n=1 Tax=Cytobacillus gottheilii TaxID=859144 RepID=UPI0034645ACF